MEFNRQPIRFRVICKKIKSRSFFAGLLRVYSPTIIGHQRQSTHHFNLALLFDFLLFFMVFGGLWWSPLLPRGAGSIPAASNFNYLILKDKSQIYLLFGFILGLFE
jgi:hypothetical protein